MEVVKELGYDKTKKALRIKKELFENQEENDKEKIDYESGAVILKILAYSLIVALIGVMLFLLLSRVETDRKIEPTDHDFEYVEDIADIDADKLYKKAVAEGNYRLAIRMHFIKCLQRLSKNKQIEWEIDKTNRDYYREITELDLKRSFRQIANIFERCWYSEDTTSFEEFQTYDRLFLDFLNKQK